MLLTQESYWTKGFFLVVILKSSLREFYGWYHDLLNRYRIFVSQMTTDVFHFGIIVIIILTFPHLWLITGFITIVTWWVPHVEQELPSLPEHPSSLPLFSEVQVAWYLVFCVMFCISLFVLLTFFLAFL